MKIDRLDHLVLTVRDLDAACEFYAQVLGLERVRFDGGRPGLRFGNQMIHLHEAGSETEPCAAHPTPGSQDLCFITFTPLEQVRRRLEALDVEVLQGPVPSQGARGPIESIACRDPDGNLLQISNYVDPEPG